MSEKILWRYWVSSIDEDGNDIIELKTEDFDEAVEKAIWLYDEWVKKNPNVEVPEVCGIEISAQPHCPNCGCNCSFRYDYCPKCGAVLDLFVKMDILDIVTAWKKGYPDEVE